MADFGKIKFEWVKQPHGIIRILGFLLSIVILALVYAYDICVDGAMAQTYVSNIGAGNLFAIFYFVFSYIFGDEEVAKRKITEIGLDGVLAILNLVAGALVLHGYGSAPTMLQTTSDHDGTLAVGIIFIVVTVAMIADVVLFVLKKG